MPEERENQLKPKPSIRTMKSDISEFLKDTKPSLIQMLATQVEAERSGLAQEKPSFTVPWLKIAVGLTLAGILLIGGYAGYQYLGKAPPQEANVIIPQPFFTVEKTTALQYASRDLENLRGAIKKERGGERLGSLKRLVILIEEEAGAIRHITPAEFSTATGLKIPELLLPTLTQVMPVYYESPNGVRLAIVFKSSDPKRFLDIFFRTESNLITGWVPLFLDITPPTRIIGFEDRLYRNIGYRILPLDPQLDLAITYGLYPAKNFLILTSSEAAFKEIVDRLFEAS